MPLIDLLVLPDEPFPEVDCWVVIDLLRATSQIATFFDCGGDLLISVAEVEEARALKSTLGESWLLMGERGGIAPVGFDLGNSPLELISFPLGGRKKGILSTSNGTRALIRASLSGRPVFSACARNASAVCRAALKVADRIGLLCAGESGRLAAEDVLCGGLLVEKLLCELPKATLSDGAKVAKILWKRAEGDLFSAVKDSSHALFLKGIGLEADVAFCCEVDRSVSVPRVVSEGLPVEIASFPRFALMMDSHENRK